MKKKKLNKIVLKLNKKCKKIHKLQEEVLTLKEL